MVTETQALIHESPISFINSWVSENGFTEVAFLGTAPPLTAAKTSTIHLVDAAGLRPLELLSTSPPPHCLIVSNQMESMTTDAGVQLLAGYRNALLGAVMVFIDLEVAALSARDFIGLGFRRRAKFQGEAHRLDAFEYNLQSYNFRRLWNNSENWANPQNFGKYWW